MQCCHTQASVDRRLITLVGREEIMLVEGTKMQLPRQIPEPQHDISHPSVASQVAGKMPKFSTFSGDSIQKG